MGSAYLWGLFSASSLILGGLLALNLSISRRSVGLGLAFGDGVLIGAVAYELVLEAAETSAGSGGVGIGLFAGAITFDVGDRLIDRLVGLLARDWIGAARAPRSAAGPQRQHSTGGRYGLPPARGVVWRRGWRCAGRQWRGTSGSRRSPRCADAPACTVYTMYRD